MVPHGTFGCTICRRCSTPRSPTARCSPATCSIRGWRNPRDRGGCSTCTTRCAICGTASDGRLLITSGRPEERIPALVKAVGATSVHVSGDYTPFGRRRDAGRAARPLGDGVPLEATGSPYLVSPGRVTKGDGNAVQGVRAVLHRVAEARLARAREDRPGIGAVDRSCRRAGRGRHPRRRGRHSTCPPARAPPARNGRSSWTRRSRLRRRPQPPRPRQHQPDVGTPEVRHHPSATDGRRSRPRQGRPGVSAGAGVPRLLRRGAARVAAQRVVELEHVGFDAIEIDEGRDAEKAFEAWKEGRTGFPIVDAGMRQLAEIGWMHNRVRMIVASFLVKDLHLPWQWGARWFLDQLVDGDMANNQHGWQWTAGSGTDAAPYFRVFNPTTQGKKFDPDGAYMRRWVRAADLPRRRRAHADDAPTYPEPIVDHARRTRRGAAPLCRSRLTAQPGPAVRRSVVRRECMPESGQLPSPTVRSSRGQHRGGTTHRRRRRRRALRGVGLVQGEPPADPDRGLLSAAGSC